MQTVNAALTADNLFDPGLINRQAFATTFISSAVLKGRLAHAYLFTGRAHEDADQLATELAAYLNCTRRQALPALSTQFSQAQLSCRLYFSGKDIEKAFPLYCQNCRWILDRKHPQALVKLDSEGAKSNRISVDKARLLTGELSMESAYIRVIVIDDANQEVFHRPAANAILKTMESPRTPCVFCLFAVREEEVLPTVVSRCQVVPLKSTENHVISFGRADAKSLLNSMPTDSENEGLAKLHSDMKELSESLKHVSRSNGALIFIEAAKKLQELNSECEPGWMIDVLVEDEINRRGRAAINDPRISQYLFSLVNLAEDTKLQIAQYVATKSALESFCLAWWQLKNTSQFW